MCNKIYLVLFCIVIINNLSFSQDFDPAIKIPSIPSAFSFEKYGDIPVGLSTGTANVSIPIYTIKHKDFNFPLYLSYHTSGVKVDEYNPDIGLGWNLNFGGMISCSVRGRYDFELTSMGTGNQSEMSELYANYFNAFSYPGSGGTTGLPLGTGGDLKELIAVPEVANGIYQSRGYTYAVDIYNSATDGSPDVFSYFFMNKNGKFMYNESLEPHTIPYDDIKIDKIYGSGGEHLLGFKITDKNGIQFIFTDIEYIESYDINGNINVLDYFLTGGPSKNRNWKLSKIVLLDGAEINFEYDIIEYSYNSDSEIKNERLGSCYIGGFSYNSRNFTSKFNVEAKRLKKITTSYDDLLIEFLYDDINNTTENVIPMGEVTIKYGGENIEKYLFNHTYYSNNKRFVLNSIKKDGKSAYQFEYNDINQFPNQNSSNRDLWGYNYGGYGTNTLLYEDITNAKVYNGKNNEPKFNSTLKGSLKKITYPTGGSTKFIYEQNQYYGTEKRKTQRIGGEVGFMDFSEYVSSDTFTIIEKKAGVLSGLIEPISNGYPSGFIAPGTHIALINETTNVNILQINLTEDNITWPYIINEEVLMSAGTYRIVINNFVENIGGSFRVKWYDVYDYEGNLNAGGLRIKEVIDKTDENSIAKIKVYKYNYPLFSEKSSGYLSGEIKTLDYTTTWGYDSSGCQIISCQHIKRSSNSMYDIGNVSYQYVTVLEQENKSIHEFTKFKDLLLEYDGELAPNIDFSWLRNIPLKIDYFKKRNEDYFVIRQIINNYENLDNHGLIHHPFHPNYNDYVNTYKESLIGLNIRSREPAVWLCGTGGYEIIPPNYTVIPIYTPTDWIYKNKAIEKQYDQNGLNPIITEVNYFYDNDQHLQLTRTETTDSTSNLIKTNTEYPQDIPVADRTPAENGLIAQHQISTPIQAETTVTDVDGNELSKTTQRTNFKDWGLNSSGTGHIILPEFVQTAKGEVTVANPLENRVTYHDYDDKGNPLEVSKTDGTHITYIWGYNQQYPVAKIENATQAEVGSFNLGDGGLSTTQADALRASLPNAQVTTYTYAPLIGVTSITDPRGYTIYYEYDEFNRLKQVKDAEGNIVSKNEYHYKN